MQRQYIASIIGNNSDWLSNAGGALMKVADSAGSTVGLYINYVFYSGWIRTLVAMATLNFHRLIMVKLKIQKFSAPSGDFKN